MIFKNARVYRFTKPVSIDAEELEQKLQADIFKPCGPQESARQGWTSPLGKRGEHLVYAAGGCFLICLQKQEKIIPGSVVSEIVEERCENIETEQNRKVRRKEKADIKDQVQLELLPQAFTRNKRIYAYLSPKDGFMIVDSKAAKPAEECASALRKSLGSLPVRPPVVEQAPAFTFTGWLSQSIDLPSTVVLGQDCELTDPAEDGGVLTAKGLNLEELTNHLDSGMQVTKISVTWDDNVSFTLDEELSISKIRFGDTFQEKIDDVDADDALARFDAAFGLMTLEFSRLVSGLLEVLGGEDRSAVVEGPAVSLTESPEPEAAPAAQGVSSSVEPVTESQADYQDGLYDEARQFVVDLQRASISGVQRKFKIGYNRAAHLVEQLEQGGVISRADHNGKRDVLIAPSATA